MAKKLRYVGHIPKVPVDADTSKADAKIDRLFEKIKDIQHVKIDADVSQAQRRLETLAKRSNDKLSSALVGTMIGDFKTVLGAMKTEYESFGDSSNIYKNLEKTCDMVEDRFSNLTISVDKKKISGLEQILNSVEDLQHIDGFSFDERSLQQVVKGTEIALSKVKEAKKEIASIAGKIDYITKTLNKKSDKTFSTEKLLQYKDKVQGLRDELQQFYSIDDELIQNSLVNAAAKINEALGEIDIRVPKAKGSVDVLSTGETLQELGAVEKKLQAIQEVSNRISKNSSINGLKNIEQEAVNVTKVLAEMYDEGIRDTERYITLQYKLSKIFDKMGKGYGGIKGSGSKDKSELINLVVDGIYQRTGVDLFGPNAMGRVMENLFGSSDFSLFNKSLSKLGMKEIAEVLLVTGKTGDWVDMQEQVTAEIEETVDALGEQSQVSKSTASSLDKLKDKYFSTIKTVEKYLGLMDKFNNIYGATTRELRKNVINFINDMPQDVIEMLGMQYGEKFINGFNNAFKGISTADLVDMIKKPSFTNVMGALAHKLDLAKNIDFDNVQYTVDGKVKLSGSDNPFEQLSPGHGIELMNELYNTLGDIVKIKKEEEEQIAKTEQLAEARLKLTPKKDGSGGYTAMDGKYDIGQDAEGWKVFQRDNAGLWNLIGTYKHLDDVRNDASLLTREEIVLTNEVIQEVKVLQEAYSALGNSMQGRMSVVNKYIELMDNVKAGALSAAEAIKQLSEVAGVKSGESVLQSNADALLNKAQLEEKAKDLRYLISNQKAWLEYLDDSLNKDKFKTSGKKEATDQLRSLTKWLISHYRTDYKDYNGEYAKEMIDVAWMHGYEEAKNQGVAQSTLDKYHIPDAEFFYNKNLATLQDEYNRRQEVLNKSTEELHAIESQIAALVQQPDPSQEKMAETIKLIADLQQRYGTEKFGEIFGDIGTIDASNAAEVYDMLISKENEYFSAVQARMQAQNEFLQINAELIQQNQGTESFMKKYAELTNSILNGNVGLEEANKQLQEFVDTLSDAAEKQEKLFKTPKNNYEKLFNTLALGDNAFETKSKGSVSGYSWAERETIAEAIIQGLQQGVDKVDIILNNGKTTLTFAGGLDSAAKILDLFGFKAVESELTKFIGRAIKTGSRTMYQSSDKGNYIVDATQLFKLSRPLNEFEYGRFEEYREKDISALLRGASNATSVMPNTVREALIDIPGDKKGKQEKHYIFQTEDGQYLVLKKSAFDNIRKVSSNVKYDPNTFKNGLYSSMVYGFGENGDVVSAMISRIQGLQQVITDIFNASPSVKTDFSLPNKNVLNIAGNISGTVNKGKLLQIHSSEGTIQENKKLQSSYEGLADTIFEALKQIRELENELRDIEYSDVSSAIKLEKMQELRGASGNIEYKQFPYIHKAFIDEDFNPTGAMVDFATTDEMLREMAESIAVYASKSKEELGELKLIKIDTSGVELLNGELRDIVDNSGKAVDAYRGLAEEAKSNNILTTGHHSGATWFSTKQEVASGYTRDSDNLYRANLKSRRLLDIDANRSDWHDITFLGDESDDVSKKITELYKKKQELKEEAMRLAAANQVESQSYKDISSALSRVTADYEYYSNASNNPYGTHDTNWYAKYAQKNGYDAVRIKNVYDTLQGGGLSDVIGVFSEEQILNVEKVVKAQIDAKNKVAEIADKTVQIKQEQVEVENNAVKQTEAQAEAEKQLAEEARKAAEAKERQAEVVNNISKKQSDNKTKTTINALGDIASDSARMIDVISSAAGKSAATKFLEGITGETDLKERISGYFNEVFNSDDWQFKEGKGAFTVKGNTFVANLVNSSQDALQAVFQLDDGVLKLQDDMVKLSKANIVDAFDLDAARQNASVFLRDLKAQLGGRAYDGMPGLESLFDDIIDEKSFNTFMQRAKIGKQEVAALKKEYANSSSSLNDFSRATDTMRNAETSIETMRMQLDRLGETDGVDRARASLDQMTESAKAFNVATSEAGQKDAYNQYNRSKSDFEANFKYAQEAKKTSEAEAKQVSAQDQQIQQYYQQILSTVNKINALDIDIEKAKKKNTNGAFTDYINKTQEEKGRLISTVKATLSEVGSLFGDGIMGTPQNVDGARFFSDTDTANLNAFLNNAQVQYALAQGDVNKLNECINQLNVSFNNSSRIGAEAAQRIRESFQKVNDVAKNIFTFNENGIIMGSNGIDENNDSYKGVLNAYQMLQLYRSNLSGSEADWTAQEAAGVRILTEEFLKLATQLDSVRQKQAQYFANKSEYISGTEVVQSDAQIKAIESQQQAYDILKAKADEFAKASGANSAMVTNFVQSADGISRLDFSILKQGTLAVEKFSMELGSLNLNKTFLTDMNANAFTSTFQSANKQLESMGELMQRLQMSGANMNHSSIVTMVESMAKLEGELLQGKSASATSLSTLTKEAKMSMAEVEKLYSQMTKMQQSIFSKEALELGKVNTNGDVYSQMTAHIADFAMQQPNATVAVGKFNEATRTLGFTLTNTKGQVREFRASVDALTGTMTAQQVGVGHTASLWSQFRTELSSVGKMIKYATVGYYSMSFQIIRWAREGVSAVKEIDAALTELKKVTDETDESYKNFLQDASKTGSEIGTKVSDFTEATANFARLGYTMSESADMAKTAIVYKNVADGIDNVEASTDSIISTMKAFGIETNDTMSIADRFNEVGNNFAITSAGIGEALQRSAAALAEGGNTIDESIALITAANTVVQNPETVGKYIAQQYSNML